MAKVMNHKEYQKSLRGKSEAELRFTIKDAGEAYTAMPEGENAGYYADEVHYCTAELQRREGINSVQRKINSLGLQGILRAEMSKSKIEIIDVEIDCVIYYAGDAQEGETFVLGYYARGRRG